MAKQHRKILAGAVQFQTHLMDIDANLHKMEQIARSTKLENAKLELLVFPELCTTGYACGTLFPSLSEPVGGRSMQRIARLAKEMHTNIIYGFPEKTEQGLYNSAAFIGADGEVYGVYRKVHLFDTECSYFQAGCDVPVFDTPLGKIGMMICWDLAFPEAARCLALQGAELLVSCSAWEYPYVSNFILTGQVRAYENCLTHIASNRVGQEPCERYIGHSAIYAAGGEILSRLEHEEEGIAIAEICTYKDQCKREEEYPFFKNRRVSAYSALRQQ